LLAYEQAMHLTDERPADDVAASTRDAAPILRRILITGASGALGGALAIRLAGPGTQLLLWGRAAARLEAVASQCRAAGAVVAVEQVDQADPESARQAALAADERFGPIDDALLVAGQGDAVPASMIVEPAAQVARLVIVNFAAPAALAAALATRMATRGRGRILLVGSAAAFHALPHAASYAGSKAGLARFAEALRLAVAPLGVAVTLVSPGFIDWADGGRPVPRALLLPLDEAARRILAAFEAGVGHAIIPRRFALLRLLDRALPAVLREPLLRRLRP
jgi:short-subunit dehydrogenase